MTGTQAALLMLPCFTSYCGCHGYLTGIISAFSYCTVCNDVALVASYWEALVSSRFTTELLLLLRFVFWLFFFSELLAGFCFGPNLGIASQPDACFTAKFSFIWSFSVQLDMSVSVNC